MLQICIYYILPNYFYCYYDYYFYYHYCVQCN